MDGFAVHAPRFREATTILRDGDHIATCREKKGEGDWAARQCKADCSSVAQVFNSSLMLGARRFSPAFQQLLRSNSAVFSNCDRRGRTASKKEGC